MTDRPLPRGAAHGLASLELAGRFPGDADVVAAWTAMVEAFERQG